MTDDRKSKEKAGEIGEEIDATGQESEKKAVKWVQEIEARNQREQKRIQDIQHEVLDKKRRYTKNPYYQSLLDLAKKELANYDIAQGYAVDVLLKPDGKLIFGLQKVGFKWYAKGMTICGEPKYDINCVERMVVQLMISLDELVLQHERHQTKEGIALPTKGKYSL